MDYYKISKDNWQCIKQFNSLADAQAYADTLGTGYVAAFWRNYQVPSLMDKLQMDLNFCTDLIDEFLEDNRIANITPEQSDAGLLKFQNILAFAQTGAVPSLQVHLPLIPIDEVFTQVRKDKYINQLNDYVNAFPS